MHSKTIAFAIAAALVFTPMLAGCGGSQGDSGSSQGPGSDGVEQEQVAAPVLDGKWRQEGHADGEDGMIGAIDGDMIALWLSADGDDWIYWCGTFEAPQSDAPYAWTSKADKGNMTGLLSSQDDTKDFSFADGKITFKFSALGETTDIVMEQVSEETGLLAELKAGEGNPVDKAESDVKDLVLKDSSYVIQDGYVQYAMAIDNPNEEFAPHSVSVTVSGKAEDGTVSFSDDWMIGGLLPGSTTYWSGQAGSGNVAESDNVEIKISVDDDDWYKTAQKLDFYQIDNVSTTTDSLGYIVVTGEITLKDAVELVDGHNAEKPMLVCVFKDAEGKLIAGSSTFTHSDLKVGEPSTFEVDSRFKDLDYATVEVYANPWW